MPKRVIGLLVATVLGMLVPGPAAEAVIVHPDHDELASLRDLPPDGIIGKWGSSSAVAISPYFFLASRHQGTPGSVTFAGQSYSVAAVHNFGGDVDLRLVQVSFAGPALPAYAPLYEGGLQDLIGEEVAIGGFGATRGAAFHNPPQQGYDWGSPASSGPVWGFNTLFSQSQFSGDTFGGHTESLQARFAAVDHPSALVGEATVGNGDSGGGWLIFENDTWHTVGVTMAVEHEDKAVYAPQFERLWAVDVTFEPYRQFITDLLAIPEPEYLLGDMNRDGVVDTGDMAAFILALTDPAAYEATYGIDPVLVGDINGDGAFDTGDVTPFIQLLVGQSAATVPEPAAGALLLGAAALLLGRQSRRLRG